MMPLLRHVRAGDAMKAVTASNKIALKLFLFVLMEKVDVWLIRSDAGDLHIFNVEKNRLLFLLKTGRKQIFQDLMLCVEGDAASIDEFREMDAMADAIKAQFDP